MFLSRMRISAYNMNVVPFLIHKTPVKISSKGRRPNDFSTCSVVLFVKKLNPVYSMEVIKYKLGEETEMTVGLGSTHFSCAIDVCVLSMIEGETSRFVIAGPPQHDCKKANRRENTAPTKLESDCSRLRNIPIGEGATVTDDDLIKNDNLAVLPSAAPSEGYSLGVDDANKISFGSHAGSDSGLSKEGNVTLRERPVNDAALYEDRGNVECNTTCNLNSVTDQMKSVEPVNLINDTACNDTHISTEQTFDNRVVLPANLCSSSETDECLDIEITLVSLTLATDAQCLTVKDLLSRASIQKDIGVACFKQREITAAFHKFGRALKYLVCIDTGDDSSLVENKSTDDKTVTDSNDEETDEKLHFSDTDAAKPIDAK